MSELGHRMIFSHTHSVVCILILYDYFPPLLMKFGGWWSEKWFIWWRFFLFSVVVDGIVLCLFVVFDLAALRFIWCCLVVWCSSCW